MRFSFINTEQNYFLSNKEVRNRSTVKRGLQRRFNQQTGWFYRRRDGQENDHEAGRADVRKIEE